MSASTVVWLASIRANSFLELHYHSIHSDYSLEMQLEAHLEHSERRLFGTSFRRTLLRTPAHGSVKDFTLLSRDVESGSAFSALLRPLIAISMATTEVCLTIWPHSKSRGPPDTIIKWYIRWLRDQPDKTGAKSYPPHMPWCHLTLPGHWALVQSELILQSRSG